MTVSGIDLSTLIPLSEEEMNMLVSGIDFPSAAELAELTKPYLDADEPPSLYYPSEVAPLLFGPTGEAINFPEDQSFEDLLKLLGTSSKDGDIRVEYQTEELVIFDKELNQWISVLTKEEIHSIYQQRKIAQKKKPRCRFKAVLAEVEEHDDIQET